MNRISKMSSIVALTSQQLLTDEFLAQYPDQATHMTALGLFVFYRTYARFIPSLSRRETYKEVCHRVSLFSIGLGIDHLKSIGYTINIEAQRKEAELLFDNMFNLRQFCSGRSMWIGGTKASEKSKCANFNCSFLNIASWEDLGDLFYMLLVGTGVGFKCTKKLAAGMPKIRVNTKLIHSDYHPLPVHQRLETTHFTTLPNGFAKIYIGDSKEAWVEALRYYFQMLTQPKYEFIHTIKISYNSVRPHGERLKTFGGTASGPEPLKEMFQGIDNTLKGKLDPSLDPIVPDEKGYGNVRPIHILDTGNLIGYNVVVGGVRRTAEIYLFDQDDYEVLFAKYGINGLWTEDAVTHHKKLGLQLDSLGIKPIWFDSLGSVGSGRFNINHRRMSNNSIAFERKPSIDFLSLVFNIMRAEGEPGFMNLEEANRRRPHCDGFNPCLTADSIILTSSGLHPIRDLVGTQFTAIVDGEEHQSTSVGFWKTGTKPVFKISLANGQEIKATDNHQFYVKVATKLKDWKEVKDLQVGDQIILSENIDYEWKNEFGTFEEGYFIGQLIGDGTFTITKNGSDKPLIDLWIPDEIGVASYRPAQIIETFAKEVAHDKGVGFNPCVKGDGYQKFRLSCSALREVSKRFGVYACEKKVPENGSYDFTRGMIQGLFDADGSVQGNQKKGVSIRLSQSDIDRLRAVQRLLLAMGIYSTIYQNRRPACKRMMPDGKGGEKEFDCKANHDLIISKDAMFSFETLIGFADNAKAEHLRYLLSQYTRNPYKTKFTSNVVSVEACGEEDVYDATIPSVHCFSANGIIAHNCGEILLSTYGVCNLTTINLVQFVKTREDGTKYLDLKGLEEAQRLSARCGLRMTLVTLELPHWDVIQKRDRLLGTSMTGVKDAMDLLDYSTEDEFKLIKWLGNIAREEADLYAKELRVNSPLLVTTVKPEGCSRKDMLITTSRGLLRLDEIGEMVGLGQSLIESYSVLPSKEEDGNPHCPYCFKIFSRRDAIKKHLTHCVELGHITYAQRVQDRLDQALTLLRDQDGVIKSLQTRLSPVPEEKLFTDEKIPDKRFISAPDGFYAPGDDGTLNKISKFYVNGKVETRKIITEDGNELESSLNHRFRVVDEDGEYVWKHVKDLEIGDLLVVKIGTHPESIESPLKSFDIQLSNGHCKRIIQPQRLTRDLAFFLGMFYGDGSVHKEGIRISCNAKQAGQIGWIQTFIKETFGLDVYIDNTSMKTAVSVQIVSQELLEWMTLNGCLKQYSYEIELPRIIRTSNKSIATAFIEGYWRADGGVHNSSNNWSICSVSERFAKELFALSRSVGINVKLSKAGPSEGSFGTRDRWILSVRNDDKTKDRFRSKILRERDHDGFWLDPIQSIAESECETFDIEVNDSHHYLMNGGTVSHNSLSQVAGGVSSGLHLSHSPFYIRRIRINAADPLAKTVIELGWVINPEVGTPGETREEQMKNARTLVIDFPVASGAKKTKFDTDVKQQLDTYFAYQRLYTEHNSSNTITIHSEEWDTARDIIYENWDNFVGVSFLSLDDHSYELAPYEQCSEQEFLELQAKMKPFDMALLIKNESKIHDYTLGKTAGACSKLEEESTEESVEVEIDHTLVSDECKNGVCPVR